MADSVGAVGAAHGIARRRDVLGLGLALGPVAFVAAWAVGGSRLPGYSPVQDAISRIAAVRSPERALMTTGFVGYGLAVGVGAVALRRSALRPCWPVVAVNAAATVAVAALPLDRSGAVDSWHAVAAAGGYASISIAPLLAAPALRRVGHRRAAAASAAVGVTVGVCLALTVATESSGLFQRLGLTVGDVWLVTTGVALALGHGSVRPSADHTERPTAPLGEIS
ncbi:MAG: DUF998 domain-containing protein [Acidimicrobiales bacterium]